MPAFRERGGAGLDWVRGIPHRPGAYTFTSSGHDARRAFPGLNEDEQVRHKGELRLPEPVPEPGLRSRRGVHPAAAQRRRAPTSSAISCSSRSRSPSPDFDPRDAVEFWDLVNRQDWAICESVQQGISARVHERGYYAPMEDFNLDIRRYVLERIGDAVGAA